MDFGKKINFPDLFDFTRFLVWIFFKFFGPLWYGWWWSLTETFFFHFQELHFHDYCIRNVDLLDTFQKLFVFHTFKNHNFESTKVDRLCLWDKSLLIKILACWIDCFKKLTRPVKSSTTIILSLQNQPIYKILKKVLNWTQTVCKSSRRIYGL